MAEEALDRPPEQRLEHPQAIRTSDKIVLQPQRRSLRKKPLAHPVSPLYRKFDAFAICYETLPRFTARSLTLP